MSKRALTLLFGLGLAIVIGACADDETAPFSGPIVRIEDQERLAVMANDIWPGLAANSGFISGVGMTGGLRMVSFVNFMDPGSVAFRMSAHVFEIPEETTPVQVQALIQRFMTQSMGMSGWHATPDGQDEFSIGDRLQMLDRYAVVAGTGDGGVRDVIMYLVERQEGGARSLLALTGDVNSFERAETLRSLHAFLESLPST